MNHQIYRTRTKAERQRWWRSLNPDQQFEYIEKIVLGKAIKRRQQSLRKMKKYGNKFSCETCFHRTTKACDDDLPNGCEWWYSPKAKKQGPKLESQHSKNLVV